MVVRDVTEERELESRFRRVLAAAPDAIIVAHRDGRIIHANDEASRLFGWDADSLLTLKVEDLVPLRMRDGHAAHREAYAKDPKVRPMGLRPFELFAKRKDGAEVPVAINLAPFASKDGGLVIAAVRDMRKEREAAEALRTARDAAEALARELESFSYSVAHDLRAPLRSVDGFSLAVLEDSGDRLDSAGRADLGRVRDAVREMSGRIDALLTLSRLARTAIQRNRVDLSALAAAIVERLRQAEPDRVARVEIQPELVAFGDERLLGIVLENLIGNAWKFTARTADARISIGRDPRSKAYWVRDNGAGFDMTQAKRLFVAFQRLHRDTEFAGTGVGLATVQRIVNMHGGKVWAEADVGKGACFHFTLGGEGD
jgi:PAS domain S-box-containing protein